MSSRPPLPPFTAETAVQKVRLAKDGWNTRDPEKVALAYTVDSRWPEVEHATTRTAKSSYGSGRGALATIPLSSHDLVDVEL
jgi:nuclear transport factor 2 (NTF2) superfamily protein